MNIPRKEITPTDKFKKAIESPWAVQAELCRRSLYYFMQAIWDEICGDTLKLNWHLEFLSSELEKVAFRVARAEPKAYDLIINVPPGTSKCVCRGEKVFTTQGFIPVETVTTEHKVFSHKDGKLFKQRVIATETYTKPCVEIETKLHNKIKISSDHPVLTQNGWKNACDLSLNDYMVSLCSKINGGQNIPYAELDFITLMLFEGGVTGGARTFTNYDPEVVSVLRQACKKLNFDILEHPDDPEKKGEYSISAQRTTRLKLLLKKYGLLDKKSIDKRLPLQFFKMPLKQKYRFISLMIATDGYISTEEHVGIALGSKELALDIRYLLMTCGIPTSYWESENGFAGSYCVVIGAMDAKKLIGKINCLQKQKKFMGLFKVRRYTLSHGFPYEVTKGLTYKCRQQEKEISLPNKKGSMITHYCFKQLKKLKPELQSWEMDHFIWDRIISIKEIGEQDVYHLQVESPYYDDQNFIVNGLVTHNSSLVSIIYPAWCWANWPWMKFINASYSGALSLEHADLCRGVLRSQTYLNMFSNLEVKLDKDTKTNFALTQLVRGRDGRIIKKPGGNRLSTSVGGTLTGFHGHQIIIDDPLNPKQAASSTELATANTWIDQTLSTRKVDKAVTPTIIIMQRLHEEDVTGYLLNKSGARIKHICLPGEILNDYEKCVKPKSVRKYYINGLLDPIRMPLSVLEEYEATLGQYGYAAQFGQNPTPPQGGMFKVSHFQIIDNIPIGETKIYTVRWWDKAGTDEHAKWGKSAAYTCGVKMTKLLGNHFVIEDVVRGKWSTNEREEIILQTAQADGVGVKIWHEQEPGSAGLDSARATITNLAGFTSHAERSTGNKITRADPYSVQVNNGNIWLLRGEWNKAFIEEHRMFPFGKLKDQVDAASGAFSKVSLVRKVAGAID